MKLFQYNLTVTISILFQKFKNTNKHTHTHKYMKTWHKVFHKCYFEINQQKYIKDIFKQTTRRHINWPLFIKIILRVKIIFVAETDYYFWCLKDYKFIDKTTVQWINS